MKTTNRVRPTSPDLRRPLRGAGAALACSTVLGLSVVGLLPSAQGEATGAEAVAPTLFDVLPRDTMFFIMADDAEAVWNSMNRTGLSEMWQVPAIQDRWEEFSESMFDDLNESYNLDLTWEELVWPSGTVGMGWMIDPAHDEDEDDAAAADDEDMMMMWEDDSPPLRFVMMMDLGERAGDFEDLFLRIYEQFEENDDDLIEVSDEEFEDRLIYSVKGLAPDREDVIAEVTELWDQAPTEEDIEWLERTGWFEPDVSPMYYLLEGSTFLASDSLRALENAILRMDGDLDDSLADSGTMQRLVDYAGGRRGVYGALQNPFTMPGDPMGMGLMDDGADLEGEEAALAEAMRAQFKALGLLDMAGVGFRMNFDVPDAMMETELGILLPDGPQGLFNLPTTAPNGFNLPNWVDFDADSFAQFSVDFDQVLPMIRSMLGSVGAAAGPDAEQMRTMFETQAAPILQMLLEVMGPNVYYATWPDRIFNLGEEEAAAEADPWEFTPSIPSNFVYAIESTDPTIVENTIVQLTAAFPLFEPRDFLGFRIYDMGDDLIPLDADLSLGFGKQLVIVGGTPAVERVLRATETTPSIRELEGMDLAIAQFPDRGWTYSVSPASQFLQTMRDVLTGDFEAGMNPAEIATMGAADMLPFWFDDDELPTVEEMREYMGHIISWGERSDRGLKMIFRILPPVDEQ